MSRHVAVAALLIDIEAVMRQQGLWQDEAPPAGALTSTLPFCYDTLELPQWLQFVMLPRFYAMVEARAQLPASCSVAPMAELWFEQSPRSGAELIALLRQLDELLGGSA